MLEFEELLTISDRLLGPGGCPWDQEQTLLSLIPYLLEEAHELIEAIEIGSGPKMAEELGDVFYALVFIGKLGEKEGSFSLRQSLREACDKLVRRHPHVFGELKLATTEEIVKNWEEIKKKEGKKSPIAGIPPTLPALARAQKIIHKLRKAKDPRIEQRSASPTQPTLGERLFDLVREADQLGVDAEGELRKHIRLLIPE
jgi:MazG family protein